MHGYSEICVLIVRRVYCSMRYVLVYDILLLGYLVPPQVLDEDQCTRQSSDRKCFLIEFVR